MMRRRRSVSCHKCNLLHAFYLGEVMHANKMLSWFSPYAVSKNVADFVQCFTHAVDVLASFLLLDLWCDST